MKTFVFLAALLFVAQPVQAEEGNLVNELESLNSPTNELPGAIEAEKIYAVKTRYSSLDRRVEFSGGAAQKVSDTGFMNTRDFQLGARYYFNSRWSAGASYSYVSNQFTSTSQRLYETQKIVPDLPYVKSRMELTARYNLFYGKFRLSMDRVLYFDQYVSAGPAMMGLSNGNVMGGVIDAGLAFWIGQNWSSRLGVKDYIYNETSLNPPFGKSLTNNVMIYLDFGYLFGKGA
jgi:outer membrane beta-barrel protein